MSIKTKLFGMVTAVVSTEVTNPVDESHAMLDIIPSFGAELKHQICDACFRHYKDIDASIEIQQPKLSRSNQTWKHLKIDSVRLEPEVNDSCVVYAIPDWDLENHMEWAINQNGQLLYAGTFLFYGVDSYAEQRGFEVDAG